MLHVFSGAVHSVGAAFGCEPLCARLIAAKGRSYKELMSCQPGCLMLRTCTTVLVAII